MHVFCWGWMSRGRCIIPAAARRHGCASDRRDTPPVDVDSVSRQVSWLAGHCCSLVFPMPCDISDSTRGNNSLLTVAGAAPDFYGSTRSSPASLLATKSMDMADRDGYIWCDLWMAVNGPNRFGEEFSSSGRAPCGNRWETSVKPPCVDAHAMLSISGRVVVLREALSFEAKREAGVMPALPPQL